MSTLATRSLKELQAWGLDTMSPETTCIIPYAEYLTIFHQSLPVALLTALHANLAQEHCGKEANVPSDKVKPEGRVQRGACWEVCKLCADLLVEKAEQRVSAERSNRDGGRHSPPA